jgi:dolichol-phosphate mannosyltransferase
MNQQRLLPENHFPAQAPHRATPSAAFGESPALSIVAPCYNEAAVLPEFHRRVTAVCQQLGRTFEIVLVDDGSADPTWQTMRELAASDSHLVLVKLTRNHGHQLALTAGLSVCQGERVLILDADLQDPPELLPLMLQVMDDRAAAVVYGQRRRRDGDGRLKRFTAALFYRLLNQLSDTPIPLDTGDFRLLKRRVLDVLQSMPERHRFLRGMVSWIGLRQEPFLYDRQPRRASQSKYSFGKMARFAGDALTSFSLRPLALALFLGLGLGVLGLLLLVAALAGCGGGERGTVVGSCSWAR